MHHRRIAQILSGVTALVIDHDMASEAKQMIETVVPDIVVCDLVLPDQNGLEFIRWLRARGAGQGRATPAIAVTFFHERFGVRETRAAGFDMFVRKPIDPMDIVHAVTLLVRPSAPS